MVTVSVTMGAEFAEEAVLGAMRALGVPDEAQASAVDARQELDLKVLRPQGVGG